MSLLFNESRMALDVTAQYIRFITMSHMNICHEEAGGGLQQKNQNCIADCTLSVTLHIVVVILLTTQKFAG